MLISGLFIRVRKSVNEYTGMQNGGNNYITSLLIHRLRHSLHTIYPRYPPTFFMLCTKMTFFAQFSGSCEQVAVRKLEPDFFGRVHYITIVTSA